MDTGPCRPVPAHPSKHGASTKSHRSRPLSRKWTTWVPKVGSGYCARFVISAVALKMYLEAEAKKEPARDELLLGLWCT